MIVAEVRKRIFYYYYLMTLETTITIIVIVLFLFFQVRSSPSIPRCIDSYRVKTFMYQVDLISGELNNSFRRIREFSLILRDNFEHLLKN